MKFCYTFTQMKNIFFLQSSKRPSNQAQLDGTLRAAKAFGWTVRVIEFGKASAVLRRHGDQKVELMDTFRKMRDFWSPLGVIVDSGASTIRLRPREFNLPTVFLDHRLGKTESGVTCVFSDSRSIAETAARELLTLNAASYAYVPYMDRYPWSIERGRLFSAALALNNQKCLCYKPTVGLPDWVAALPRPAAIFAANDFVGEQVISAATRLGLSVPDDVAVLGVDNDEEICLRAMPTLSSIKPDHEQAGYLAADLLRQLIRNPKQSPAPQSFGTLAVFHRASTRALRRHDEKAMRLIETIRRMATDTVTIPELAKEFGLAVRTIELRFKEATGHSIRDEIQSLRLERAKVLLAQPRIKMSEVAAASGYPSLLAFRKTFKRLTGAAPGKWRKSSGHPLINPGTASRSTPRGR